MKSNFVSPFLRSIIFAIVDFPLAILMNNYYFEDKRISILLLSRELRNRVYINRLRHKEKKNNLCIVALYLKRSAAQK